MEKGKKVPDINGALKELIMDIQGNIDFGIYE